MTTPKRNPNVKHYYIETGPDAGQLATYAWPGGYPLFYVTADAGILCPNCANENAELIADKDDSQWYITGADANWENPFLYCDHCSKPIDPAYLDDDELKQARKDPDAWEESH